MVNLTIIIMHGLCFASLLLFNINAKKLNEVVSKSIFKSLTLKICLLTFIKLSFLSSNSILDFYDKELASNSLIGPRPPRLYFLFIWFFDLMMGRFYAVNISSDSFLAQHVELLFPILEFNYID